MGWLTASRNWLAGRCRRFAGLGPEIPVYEAWVAVRVHWAVYAVCAFILIYRPYYGPTRFAVYALAMLVLVAFNGYLHFRLRSDRPPGWQWFMALLFLDCQWRREIGSAWRRESVPAGSIGQHKWPHQWFRGNVPLTATAGSIVGETGRLQGESYASSGSSEAWSRAFSRLCLSR